MSETILHLRPRILKATERPSPSPPKVVRRRNWGTSATNSVMVEPGARIVPARGDWPVTVPGAVPGAGTLDRADFSFSDLSRDCAAREELPASFGTLTGRGPALRMTATLVPSTTRV